MKTFETLVNELKTLTDEIQTIENWMCDNQDTFRSLADSKKFDELRTMRKDIEPQEIEKSKRLELLKVAQKILKENIRQAYFHETMPKVLEVLKKYEGKPIGEKTEAKIRDELSKQGIHFSISYGGQYSSDYIHFSPGFGSVYSFRYDDMKIYTQYDGGNKRPMFGGTNGNRLIVYDLDMYYLYWCSDYVDDYMFRANTILYKYKELKEHRASLEEEYKSFNDLLPRSMNRLNLGDHLYTSIA